MTVLRKLSPAVIDQHVGMQIRLRRQLLGLSQKEFGSALGLTFQQIQKYEKGTNRIAASRLFRMTQILQVPFSYFYERLQFERVSNVDTSTLVQTLREDESGSAETLTLIRSYFSVTPERRSHLLDLIETLQSDPAA